jgi:hypothetical protein
MVHMGIFKNQKIIITLEIIIFSILAFIIGSAQTVSPFYGDLNLIDEGQFAAWANQMLHGKLMFKDIYITYGPLYVYPLYLLFKIFSPSAFLVRIYFILGSIVGIVTLNLLMLNLGIKRIGRYAFNILLILLPIIILRQALGFLVIYFLILTETKNNKVYPFFVGLFSVLTFLTSPELGIIVTAIATLYFIYRTLRVSKSGLFKTLYYVLFGLILPTVIFVVWAGTQGWLASFFQTTGQIFMNFSGVNVPNGQGLPDVFELIPRSTNILGWFKFVLSKEIFVYYIMILNVYMLLFMTVKLILKKTNPDDLKIILILLFSLPLIYLYVSRPDFPHVFFGLTPLILLLTY